jgi:peptidoglycan/LPS O-acetylase OafA/YrhL
MPADADPAGCQAVSPAVAGFRLGQRPCLDGLRGFAVLAVVLTHFHLIPGGVIGVEILFVLSGFLITVLLIEEREKTGAISLPNFFRRRFLRIIPPLVAMLVIGSLVSLLMGYRSPGQMFREVIMTGAFLGNGQTWHGIPLPTFGHTWTLALEVQFYLLWPVAFYFLLRANVRRERILQLLVLLVVASMAWRIVLFTGRPPSGPMRQQHLMRLFMGIDTHSDTLLIGCLAGALVAWNRLGSIRHFERKLRLAGWFSVVCLGFLILRCHHEQHGFYCGLFTLTGLWVAAFITWLVLAPPRLLLPVFESAVLVGLGRISYALYLFHQPICQWMKPRGAGPISLALGLSLAAAIISFYTIERPFIRAKKRPAATTGNDPQAIPAARRVA